MSVGDWLRRLFSSPLESPEEEATLRDEYGSSPERGPDVERPEVPMAIPGSGGIDPDARPGTPPAAEEEPTAEGLQGDADERT